MFEMLFLCFCFVFCVLCLRFVSCFKFLYYFMMRKFVFYSTAYFYIYILVIYDPDGNFRTNMAPFVHQFCTDIGRGCFLLYTSEIGTFALKWHLFGTNFALV